MTFKLIDQLMPKQLRTMDLGFFNLQIMSKFNFEIYRSWKYAFV